MKSKAEIEPTRLYLGLTDIACLERVYANTVQNSRLFEK